MWNKIIYIARLQSLSVHELRNCFFNVFKVGWVSGKSSTMHWEWFAIPSPEIGCVRSNRIPAFNFSNNIAFAENEGSSTIANKKIEFSTWTTSGRGLTIVCSYNHSVLHAAHWVIHQSCGVFEHA